MGKNTPDRQEFIIKNLKVELDAIKKLNFIYLNKVLEFYFIFILFSITFFIIKKVMKNVRDH
jgi:hypothetical protein